MKIEVGKFYKTRDGRKVRIYALDGEGEFPIHGAVYNYESSEDQGYEAGWETGCWNHNSQSAFMEHENIVSEWENLRKSDILEPGEYILSFPEYYPSEIKAVKATYEGVKNGEQDYLHYIKTDDYGYFEGDCIEDVRFIKQSPYKLPTTYELWRSNTVSPEPFTFHNAQKALKEALLYGSGNIKIKWDETSGVLVSDENGNLSTMCSCGGKLNTHKPTCPENRVIPVLADPNPYIYIDEAIPAPMRPYLPKKKCECGSDSLGSSKHSSYCPKFEEDK